MTLLALIYHALPLSRASLEVQAGSEALLEE